MSTKNYLVTVCFSNIGAVKSHTLFRDGHNCVLLKITFSNIDESRLKVSARMVVERPLAKSGATNFVLLIWA